MDKQHSIDELFAKARQQQPVATFSETRNRFLQEVGTTAPAGKGKLFTFKKWIIMLSIIATLTAGLLLFSTLQTPISPARPTLEKEPLTPLSQQPNGFPSEEPTGKAVISAAPIESEKPAASNELPNTFPGISDPVIFPASLFSIPLVPRSVVEDGYVFPKLTEEEIATTRKQKKAMLKALAKMDKKSYAYIPTGTFNYDGKTVSVQSFYMQTTEVTNFEYRTFLFDLLIQGKKDDFLIAKPDQTMWTKVYDADNKPMEDLYFSHPVYNNYPVVNISREGAELYCKWLNQELANYDGAKKQESYNDVRLPSRTEWVFAASSEGKYTLYPWEGTEVRNSKGSYLANFQPSPGDHISDGTLHTGPVNSYYPDDHGLYCLSGNVSEMVYNADNSRKEPGTAGGNWESPAEEIQLFGKDPYAGITEARPTIGFRVVMTVLSDGK